MSEEDENKAWVDPARAPKERIHIRSHEPNQWPPKPTLEEPSTETRRRHINPILFVLCRRLLFGGIAGITIGFIAALVFGGIMAGVFSIPIGAIAGLVFGFVDGTILAIATWIILRRSNNDYRLGGAVLRKIGPVTTLVILIGLHRLAVNAWSFGAGGFAIGLLVMSVSLWNSITLADQFEHDFG